MHPPRGRRGRRHRRFQSRFDAPSFPLFFVGVSPRRQRQRQTSSSRVPRSFPSSSSSSSSTPSWSSKWCRVRALKLSLVSFPLLLVCYPKPFDFCSQIFFSPEREREILETSSSHNHRPRRRRKREREREKTRERRDHDHHRHQVALIFVALSNVSFCLFLFLLSPPPVGEKDLNTTNIRTILWVSSGKGSPFGGTTIKKSSR